MTPTFLGHLVFHDYEKALAFLNTLPDVGPAGDREESDPFKAARLRLAWDDIAKHGGCAIFPVLLDYEGEVVGARVLARRSTVAPYEKFYKWAIFRDGIDGAEKVEWLMRFMEPRWYKTRKLRMAYCVAPAWVDFVDTEDGGRPILEAWPAREACFGRLAIWEAAAAAALC